VLEEAEVRALIDMLGFNGPLEDNLRSDLRDYALDRSAVPSGPIARDTDPISPPPIHAGLGSVVGKAPACRDEDKAE
jgi:hypothetical protein